MKNINISWAVFIVGIFFSLNNIFVHSPPEPPWYSAEVFLLDTPEILCPAPGRYAAYTENRDLSV